MNAPKGTLFLLAAGAAAAFVLGAPFGGRSATVPDLGLREAWTRPAVRGAGTAGYLRIDNRTGHADVLIGAESPVAAAVSIHESRLEGQVMTMRLLKSLEVPSGRGVTLEPGGLHLMMSGLRRPLRPGDHFPVTLIFARAGRRGVEFAVALARPSAGAPSMRT
jgi:hypothetical protein